MTTQQRGTSFVSDNKKWSVVLEPLQVDLEEIDEFYYEEAQKNPLGMTFAEGMTNHDFITALEAAFDQDQGYELTIVNRVTKEINNISEVIGDKELVLNQVSYYEPRLLNTTWEETTLAETVDELIATFGIYVTVDGKDFGLLTSDNWEEKTGFFDGEICSCHFPFKLTITDRFHEINGKVYRVVEFNSHNQ